MINFLSTLECILSAFHDFDDGLLDFWSVDAAMVHDDAIIFMATGNDLVGIAQNREIGIVCGEDELCLGFHLPNQFNDVFVDGLVVKIILGLVYEHQVIFPLGQNEQDQGGCALPQGVIF